MKALLITTAILVMSVPAIAGTAVNNTTTIRNSTGSGRTDFSSLRNSVGMQDNYSQSIKFESTAPSAAAAVEFKNGSFTGNAWGTTNPTNPDPIAIGSYASQRETINFTQTDSMNGFETYGFTENMTDHRVSSDSDW